MFYISHAMPSSFQYFIVRNNDHFSTTAETGTVRTSTFLNNSESGIFFVSVSFFPVQIGLVAGRLVSAAWLLPNTSASVKMDQSAFRLVTVTGLSQVAFSG